MLVKSVRVGEVPPKRHHESWIVQIILFLVVAGVALYFYRRRRQKLPEQLVQYEMTLLQNIENYEQKTKSDVISNSKQDLSTPSDKQSLSRATTPEVLPIAIRS